MKELKRATIIFLSFLVLVTLVSVVLAFVPVRQRQVDVPKGFYYGEATNQVSTHARGNYESATYDIQRFSAFYAVVNVVFWLGLVAALLAPVTIFYRPQKKPVEVKAPEKKTESQVKNDANPRD